MPDPFEALRMPLTPIDPDPIFAASLRGRIAHLLTPGGPSMSSVGAVDIVPTTAIAAATVVPYLIVSDARRALDWYASVLAARRHGEPIVMPDGRIGHSELQLAGGAAFYLADDSPDLATVAAPRPGQAASVTLVVEVPAVDAAVDRALAAGATLERPAQDHPHGRNAVIHDPFGHRWMLSGPVPAPMLVAAAAAAPASNEPAGHPSEVAYASLLVPDVEAATAFFASVLGWTYAPGSGPQGRQVLGCTPHHGLWGGEHQSTVLLCYTVDDIAAATARVTAAGGRAEPTSDRPYGRLADCVDDQGMGFSLLQPHGGAGAGDTPATGVRHGDLAYVTLEVADAAQARAFFASVLGWRFRPGRDEQRWQVEGVAPMAGMRGGAAVATAVPMYRVDDIVSAAERVRSAGGRATTPEQLPYGLSSECVDNQGTRFFLGQL